MAGTKTATRQFLDRSFKTGQLVRRTLQLRTGPSMTQLSVSLRSGSYRVLSTNGQFRIALLVVWIDCACARRGILIAIGLLILKFESPLDSGIAQYDQRPDPYWQARQPQRSARKRQEC